MESLRNAVEPGSIALAFTIGTLINRRRRHRKPITSNEDGLIRPPDSLRDNPPAPPHLFGRFLNYFPFLLEIWYWNLTYWVYQLARAYSACRIRGNESILSLARSHALSILSFEHHIGIDIELGLQRYILQETPSLMAVLARIYYSHIFVGVVFIIYIYTYLPRTLFRRIRRTIAVDNLLAFIVITTWRCMPPRLLPEDYGFVDILHNGRQSAWNHNRFQLTIAAMPSLHFGTAAFIGVCLFRFAPHRWIRILAPLWPAAMLITILSTANHFILDAVVGSMIPVLGWRLNKTILVLEPWEAWVFRLCRMKRLDIDDEDGLENFDPPKASNWLI